MNKQEKIRANISAHPYVPHLLEDIKAAHRPEESKPADFPPSEQLIDWDIEMICDAFEDLLFSWNAGLSLPGKIPLRLRYKLTFGVLNEEYIPMSIGYITFDYCSGYAPDCPLGKYCPCLEIWKDNGEEE